MREMQRLMRAFEGYLANLTTAMVEQYKVQRSQDVSPATVNRELALLKHMLTKADDPKAPYLRPIVVMALHTGIRLGETLGLQWSDIDVKQRLIIITRTKNNERKTVPINDVLAEELRRLPRYVSSPYLFHHPDGTRLWRIDRSFHHPMTRAGIEDFRFHDLRHTHASHLAMRGVPLETIGALLGHKDPKMTKRYAHVSPTSLKAAVTTFQDLPVGT
jgi:integrase